MISELLTLLPFSQSVLWAGFVVFLRVGAMMAILPAFGEQSVPVRVRLAITLAFCAVVTPALSEQPLTVPSDIFIAIVPLLIEVIVGLFFGLLLRFFVLLGFFVAFGVWCFFGHGFYFWMMMFY